MPDIEPEEVNGLQGLVSKLKSIRNRHELTIKDNPQNEYEWKLDECIKRLRSFRLFSHEVHPDYLDSLLSLCVDLEYYLCESSTDDYLMFNLEKHDKYVIYKRLYTIWTDCFDSYTEKQWFCKYIAQKTNIADNGDAVRKGLDNHK